MSSSFSDNPAAPVPTAPSRRRVFVSRLSSTLVLWMMISAALYLQQSWIFILLAAVFGLAGTYEYSRLLRADVEGRLFQAWSMILALGYWLSVGFWSLKHGAAAPLWLDLAVLMLSLQGGFILCYRRPLAGEATLVRLFHCLMNVAYTVISFGFMVKLLYWPTAGTELPGLFLVLFLIAVTKFSDMGAYLLGVLFGKHKMIPHISPAKSWEGLAGAFLGAFTAAILLMSWAPERLAPLTWLHALILAPLLCGVAVVGDLAESVLKRCVAIKDSGHKFPGIGGILDLTDSLLFTAPVFYFYLLAVRG
jgi:phosphatidate cytidylyltransferase